MYVSALGVAVVFFSQQPSVSSVCCVLNTQKWQLVLQAAWQAAASVAGAAKLMEASPDKVLKAMLLYGCREL
jgi:hypothetical protein